MKLAVVGATGLVGTEICKVLEELELPFSEFYPVASQRSIGKLIRLKGKEYPVIGLEEAVELAPDIALFSAGSSTSLEWAPKFAKKGTYVIDNSSAFRMDSDKPLIVPEINGDVLKANDHIIANPNCSTIQMVVALNNLHKKYQLKRLVISTYQSFTGTGVKAVNQYESEKKTSTFDVSQAAYHHPIFENCIPHCDIFLENDYTKEEMKLVHETRKILNAPTIGITATAVRVPVHGGHSEAINAEFCQEFAIEEIKDLLSKTEGVILEDEPKNNKYPMPHYAKGKNGVYVGRVRLDESQPNTVNLWVVADNLRKGAATNAVQIAQYLIDNNIIKSH